jgi:DNA-3-methyladenine glycosylase
MKPSSSIKRRSKLRRSFYARPTLTVARGLIGKRLVRRVGGRRLSGIIVETEAYMGPSDVASHSRHGPESRAAPMFGEPGHAYVYFTYGMHYCINVVTEPKGSGTAVLIRAIEPDEGIEVMRRNRKHRYHPGEVPDKELTNGPSKLCQALAIDKRLNRDDLLSNQLWLEQGRQIPNGRIAKTARIGIRQGREHHWRFYSKDSAYVSRHPAY